MQTLAKTTLACGDCPIRHAAVCSLCEPHELDILEGIKSYRTFAPGETISDAGTTMTHVGTVVEGVATLSRTLEDGRRQVTGILLPSDFIGRPWRATMPFEVTAATETLLCRFERKTFERVLADTPHVSERLLAMTLDELDAARDWSVVLGRMAARERIAAVLLSLMRRRGQSASDGSYRFDLPLTRETMADALGLTLETASRQITALRKDGVIETQGRTILVPDPERLQEEAQDDADGVPLL